MSINLTDEIEVKTKKGKLGAAKQIFLKGDTQTVEKEIQDINSRHNTLNTKHESLNRTVQGIAATGGASIATNVTYNNNNSELNAENVQDAIDELKIKEIKKIKQKTEMIEQYSIEGKFYLNGQVFYSGSSASNNSLIINNDKRRLLTTVKFRANSNFNNASLVISKQKTESSFIVTNVIPLQNYSSGSVNTVDLTEYGIIVEGNFAVGIKNGDFGMIYGTPISKDSGFWKLGYTINVKNASVGSTINITTVGFSYSILVDYKEVDTKIQSESIFHKNEKSYNLFETIEKNTNESYCDYGGYSSAVYNPTSAGDFSQGPLVEIDKPQIIQSVTIHVITAKTDAKIVVFEHDGSVYKNKGNFAIGDLAAGMVTIDVSSYNIEVKNKFFICVNTAARWISRTGFSGVAMTSTSFAGTTVSNAIIAFMHITTKLLTKDIPATKILDNNIPQSSVNDDVRNLETNRYQWREESIQLPRNGYPFNFGGKEWSSANSNFQPLDIPYRVTLEGVDFYWYDSTVTSCYFFILKYIHNNEWSILKSVLLQDMVKGTKHVSFGDGVILEKGRYAIGTNKKSASFLYTAEIYAFDATMLKEIFPFGRNSAISLYGNAQGELINEGDIVTCGQQSTGSLLFRYYIKENIIVDKSNPLWGKTMYVVGDSEAEGLISLFYRYSSEIGAKNNMKVINKAVSGSVLAGTGLISHYREWIGSDADYILAQIGYNDRTDFYTNTDIPDDSRDTKHFKGAFNMFLFGLLAYYPKAKVLIVTPHSFGNAGYVIEVTDGDISAARLTIPKTRRSQGLITYYYDSDNNFHIERYTKGYGEPSYLEDDVWKENTYWSDLSKGDFNFTGENDALTEFIEKRCAYFHVPCINPTKELGLNYLASGLQRDFYCSDTAAATHLSIEGNKRVAVAYEHRLRLI